jgi:superfamily II DNA or RNA helicase
MFLLSAKSYNEANKRNSYLKKVARLQKRQFELIKQHKNLIHQEIGEISNQKSQKELALNEKKEEKSKIEFDKFKKEKSYSKLKQEEREKLMNTKRILIATYSMCKEGFDLEKLNTLLLATSRPDVDQIVGRILRIEKDKRKVEPLILDIVDPAFRRQFQARLTLYKSRNYIIEKTAFSS